MRSVWEEVRVFASLIKDFSFSSEQMEFGLSDDDSDFSMLRPLDFGLFRIVWCMCSTKN